MLKSLSCLGLLVGTAVSHGVVQSFKTDGVEHGGYILNYYYDKKNGKQLPELAAWSAENLDTGFVPPENYTSPDMVCQKNGAPATSSVKVSAGGTVEFRWTKWAHFGPMMTYVARCPGDDCTTVDKTALEWVKIDEAGIDLDTQEWAATAMVNNNLTWVTNVPKTLAAGHYVFRHETIAVHGSFREGGAQNYPQCFNIEITGSGTAQPKGVVASELYTPTDPGILFNPYKTPITNYTIPGPALFKDDAADVSAPVTDTASATPALGTATGQPFVNATTVATPVQSSVTPVQVATSTISPTLVSATPVSTKTKDEAAYTFTPKPLKSSGNTKAKSSKCGRRRRHAKVAKFNGQQ